MQPCNKLAAGPGCNPAFTPRHLRLDPSSPHPSAVKENRGTVEDFSARSRSKQNNGAIRNHKVQPGVQMVILYLLSFAHANISCHQIKVRNGMRHRGCEGCALLLRSGARRTTFEAVDKMRKICLSATACGTSSSAADASAGPVVSLLKTRERQNTNISQSVEINGLFYDGCICVRRAPRRPSTSRLMNSDRP